MINKFTLASIIAFEAVVNATCELVNPHYALV